MPACYNFIAFQHCTLGDCEYFRRLWMWEKLKVHIMLLTCEMSLICLLLCNKELILKFSKYKCLLLSTPWFKRYNSWW